MCIVGSKFCLVLDAEAEDLVDAVVVAVEEAVGEVEVDAVEGLKGPLLVLTHWMLN